MQFSWLSIAFLVTALILGIVSIVISKGPRQRAAVAVAVITLLLVWSAYLVATMVFDWAYAVWVFAPASVVFPVLLYFVIISKRGKATHGSSAPAVAVPPLSHSARLATNKPVEQQPLSNQPQETGFEPSTQPTISPQVQTPQTPAAKVELPTIARELPVVEALPPIEEPDASRPDLAVTAEFPAFRTESETSGIESSGSAPSVEDQPQTGQQGVSYETCFAKAEAMAERGHWSISAVLYEECSSLADDRPASVRALFAAIAAYTKANKNGDAKRLVAVLQAEQDLSRAQTIKLQTIAKILR